MGACFSATGRPASPHGGGGGGGGGLVRPAWRAGPGQDAAKVQAMRAEFWDTAPAYGGDAVIWQALAAAAAAAPPDDAVILDAAGVILPPPPPRAAAGAPPPDTVCFDERGREYRLPAYVLSDPV